VAQFYFFARPTTAQYCFFGNLVSQGLLQKKCIYIYKAQRRNSNENLALGKSHSHLIPIKHAKSSEL